MNNKIPFLITIDTEGDNLWSRPEVIKTSNAKKLYRFQELCNKYGFKPTYLTNYEMAMCDDFVRFGEKCLRANQCEIGMHLHAWNSPPIVHLTENDYINQPYLIDYDQDIMEEKIAFITKLLQERFQQEITTHRAGRWAMNEVYMNLLEKYHYTVDCSVTPGISWKRNIGGNPLSGGTDYCLYPKSSYHPSKSDIAVSGDMKILEVPVSVVKKIRCGSKPFFYNEKTFLRNAKLLNKICTYDSWVRPSKGNLQDMLETVQYLKDHDAKYIQFVLHSSEMTKGLNPTFLTDESIEKLFSDMEKLFKYVSPFVIGQTMNEFYLDAFKGSNCLD